MPELKIPELIEAAEGLLDHAIVQEHITGASEAGRPVQVVTGKDGNMYELWVVIRPYRPHNRVPL